MRTATTDTCTVCGMDAPHYDAEGRCAICSPVKLNGNGAKWPVDLSTSGDMNNPSSELQKRAQALIHKYGGVRAAALALSEQLGVAVNHGVLSMAAAGQDSPAARRALGVPLPIPVDPCPDCGKVHRQYKTCQPRPKKGNKRTFAIRMTAAQFEQVAAAADAHPRGRLGWALEHSETIP